MAFNLGLERRAVLVTGASRGIGRAVAEGFAREGARLTVVARDPERLGQVGRELAALGAGDVLTVPGNVAAPDDLHACVSATVERFGSLDVVVANAGGPPSGRFFECTDEMWMEGFQRNFLSLVRLTRLAVPLMRMRSWGRIIQISSVAARQPIEGLTISSSLRAGLLGMVRSLAAELAPNGITVNCILPGYTRTEHVEELAAESAALRGLNPEQTFQNWLANIPAGRLAKPTEIADAVLFLASDRAAYITGSALPIDGGFVKGIG
jgi:3-oxoacyl-[acyl-carrier protein] reductase